MNYDLCNGDLLKDLTKILASYEEGDEAGWPTVCQLVVVHLEKKSVVKVFVHSPIAIFLSGPFIALTGPVERELKNINFHFCYAKALRAGIVHLEP